MEITEQILKRVMQESLGTEVLPITLLLNQNEELSEIKLSTLLKTEVNETRRILYKLHHQNLVSFKKKKDEESGWYTYYWKLNMSRMNVLVENVSATAIRNLNNRLKKEKTTQFFECRDNCVRLDQDAALIHNFKCPECGQVLMLEDNTKKILKLQENLREIKTVFKMQNA
ncbi:MAG: hypothetical protein ACLFPQ_06820 [Candidatus Woesearchaeota archaeon]